MPRTNNTHDMRFKQDGFIAWCMLIATSLIVSCAGLYAMTVVREYHERTVTQAERWKAELLLESCRAIVGRMLAGNAYLYVGQTILPRCTLVAQSATTMSSIITQQFDIVAREGIFATSTRTFFTLDSLGNVQEN